MGAGGGLRARFAGGGLRARVQFADAVCGRQFAGGGLRVRMQMGGGRLRVRVGGNADFVSTSLTKRHGYSSSLLDSPLRPSPVNSAPHLSMRYSHIDEL